MFPVRRRESTSQVPSRRRGFQPPISIQRRRQPQPMPMQRRRLQPMMPLSRRAPQSEKSGSDLANLKAYFKDTDGNVDLDKIVGTAEQLNKLYGNVRPLFSRFLKR